MDGFAFIEVRAMSKAAQWPDPELRWALIYLPNRDHGGDGANAVFKVVFSEPPEASDWERPVVYEGTVPDSGWHTVPDCSCVSCRAERAAAEQE